MGTVLIKVPVNVSSTTASSVTNTAQVVNVESVNCATAGVCQGSTTNPVSPNVAQLNIAQAINGTVTSPGPWPFSYTGTNGVGSPTLSNTATGTSGMVNSPTYTLSATETATTVNVPVKPGWYVASASCTDNNAATTGNPTGNLATASGSTWGGFALTIPAANVRGGSAFQCQVVYSVSALRLITVMAAARLNDSDQFTATVTDAAVNVSTTTTGTGTSVGGGDSGWRTFNWGAHTLQQVMTSGSASALSQYTTSVSCSNMATAGTNVSAISKIGDTFTTKDGDVITCTITNTPMPRLFIQQVISGNVSSPGPWPFSYTGSNGVGSPTLSNNAVGQAGAVNSASYVLSAAGTATVVNVPVSPGWYVNLASCTDTNAAVTGNPTGNLATASGSTWGPYVLTIPAANVRSGSVFQCQVGYSVSGVRLITRLVGSRINDADQFTAKVTDPSANISTTTNGTGATLGAGDSGWRTFNWGPHTIDQTMATGSSSLLSQYTTSVSCSNMATAGTNVSAISKIGDTFTSKDGDVITCTITNTPKPATLFINQAVSNNLSTTGPWNFSYSGTNGVGSPTLSSTVKGWPPGVNSSAFTLSNVGVATDVQLTAPAGWYIGSAYCQDNNAANTGNPTGALSTASGNIWGAYKLTIPAANVRAGSAFQCFASYGQSAMRVRSVMGGNRINANDQFTVQLQTGKALVSKTTTGSGSGVDLGTGDTGVQTANWGNHTIEQLAAGTTNLSQYTSSVSCSNEASAGTNVSGISKVGDVVTIKDGDVITCTITNTAKALLFINQSVNTNVTSPGPWSFGYSGTNGVGSPTLSNSATGTAGAVNSAVYPLSSLNTATTLSGQSPPGWYLASASCIDTNSAVSGNPSTSIATGSGDPWATFALNIAAANVRPGAVLQCTLVYGLSSMRVRSVMGGNRINANDQFTVQLQTGKALVSKTTTGSGSGVDLGTGDTGVQTANWGNHTIEQLAAGTTNLSQYTSSVSCSNEASAGTNVSGISKVGDVVTIKDGDVITCTITNTPKAPTLFVTQTLTPTAHRYPVHVTYNANNGWQAQRLSSLSNEPLSGDVQTLSSPGVQMDFSLSLPSNNRWSIRELSCTDSNAAVSGNPSTGFGTVTGGKADKFTIDASNVRAGARLQCQLLLFAPFPY